jgi:ABC-type Na+ transport system ATPase subunit NatA
MTAETSADIAIELTGVTRHYGKATAVDDLTLHIPRGHTFGLIGPNGAGKSTTIKMLLGLLRPHAGRVRVLGIDVFAEPSRMRERVGYVPEVPQMYRWMRVGELIRFTRALYPTWNDDECARLLDLFALDPARKVKHLSRGMAAKLSLLVALAHEPEVLVLDEPTSGLDPIVREEFLDGVDELLGSARRIRAVLRDGCLPRREPAGVVWQRVERREWLLTVSDFSPNLLQALRAENDLEHVEVTGLNLEELFKDFVKGRRVPT